MPVLTHARRPLTALALVLAVAGPALAQDPGAYLAAKVAANDGDHRAAAAWFAKALISDKQNPELMEGAIIANIALGDLDKAAAAAHALQSTGLQSQSMHLALMVEQVKAGDYKAVLGEREALRSIGALVEQLSTAWAELGDGRVQDALASFDAVADTQGLEAFGLYHKALALASVGDLEQAQEILAGTDGRRIALTRRGVIAQVQILSQLERNDEAQALLDQTFDGEDVGVASIREKLAAGETLQWDIARNAQDGMSEVFFTLASALMGEARDSYTLVYARIATALRPDHAEAQVLAGDLLAAQGQTVLASEAYGSIPTTDPLYQAAEIGRAEALFGADRGDDAVAALQILAEDHPAALPVQLAYGDALRRQENYESALRVYDRVVGLIDNPDRRYWPVWFSRGMSNERLGNLEAAETDLRRALELDPEQPNVLNYLGYTLVEQNRKLDEALDMIQRAVTARPDSGAIQDSLGWALFRMGRFDEAVAPMEKAAELEPTDAVLTDHLGDVYWAVGRKVEARFQWRRALSFEPEADQVERIEKKLKIGLDRVLADEGQEAFAVKLAENAHAND